MSKLAEWLITKSKGENITIGSNENMEKKNEKYNKFYSNPKNENTMIEYYTKKLVKNKTGEILDREKFIFPKKG